MLILKGSKKLSIAFFKSKSVIKCDLLLAFNDTAKAAWLFLRVRLINNSFLKSTKFQSCSKCVILAEFEKLLMQKKKNYKIYFERKEGAIRIDFESALPNFMHKIIEFVWRLIIFRVCRDAEYY